VKYTIGVFVVSLPQYLTKFQWDLAKYPIKQSLKNISDIISKVIQCVLKLCLSYCIITSWFDCCEPNL